MPVGECEPLRIAVAHLALVHVVTASSVGAVKILSRFVFHRPATLVRSFADDKQNK